MVIASQNIQKKAGYKQTEVGLIPGDWELVKIGDYAFVTKLAGFEYTKHFDYQKSGPIIAIRALNIKDGKLDLTDIHTLPYKTSKMLSRSQLAKGDLVISYVGTLGRVAVILEDDKFHLAPNVAKISVNINQVNPFYLSHFLNGETGQEAIFKVAASTTQAALSMHNLREVTFILPPLPEQRAIATALNNVDALITSLDQLIAKKRDIKQATIQQLLTGKTRLPDFSREMSQRYKKTDIGMIPVDWNVYKFGQIATVRKKRVDPKRLSTHSFCIELEHIGQDSGKLLGSSTTTEESSLKTQFHTGDILFGRLRAYLRKYWLADRDGVCSTEIWPLVPYDDITIKQYLLQIVQTNQFIEVASFAYGTHMPRTDWNVIKNYEVSLPSLKEQQAIATVLSDMDAEIVALEQRRDKTRALKQGMMQELLTGKTRLL